MYTFLTILGCAGAVIAWTSLTAQWARIDPMQFQLIKMDYVLYRRFPGDDGYLSLKFSILRHAIVFLVFSVLIYCKILPWVLLALYSIYTIAPVQRYAMRKSIISTISRDNEIGDFQAECLSIPLKDSIIVVWYSVAANIILFLLVLLISCSPVGSNRGDVSDDVLREVPEPLNGDTFVLPDAERLADLSIHTYGDDDYYFVLAPIGSDEIVMSFYVHGGTFAKVPVPLGKYRLFFAVGTDWLGPELLFGEDTTYYQSPDNLFFYFDGRKYVGDNLHVSYAPEETVSPERFPSSTEENH